MWGRVIEIESNYWAGPPQPGGTITTSNRDNAPTLDLHRTTSGYAKSARGRC